MKMLVVLTYETSGSKGNNSWSPDTGVITGVWGKNLAFFRPGTDRTESSESSGI